MKKKEKREISKQEAQKLRQTAVIKEMYRQGEYAKVTAFVNDFIHDYPSDSFGKYYYAKLLRRNGMAEEALEILEGIEYEQNFAFYLDIVKCYFELGHFYRVIDMCEECFNRDLTLKNEICLRRIYIYVHQKLHLPVRLWENADYMDKQLYHYDRDLAIDMTQERFGSNTHLQNIDIQDLFSQIEGLLPDSKHDPNLVRMEDFYYFHYPNVGYSGGEVCDFLRVETIYGTKYIVNMYPVKELNVMTRSLLNICPFLLECDQTLERPSQIDKFNQKYAKVKKM